MKQTMRLLSLASLLAPAACVRERERSPISKVMQLLGDLQAKIIGEGEEATKTYNEFAEWCEERSKSLQYEIKTGKGQVEELKASISEDEATAATLEARLEKLAGVSAKAEGELKKAKEIRTSERKDFQKEDKELSEIVDTLQRAIGILEREMQKGAASMVQVNSATSVAEALSVMVQASALSSADYKQLTALVQQQQSSEQDPGAPAAEVYEGQSGGIISTLQELLDKAEAQLSEARSKETAAMQNFQLIKQSLEDEMKNAAKEIAEAKVGLSAASERKASAEGDLQATSAELKTDITTLADLHDNCMGKARDYEAETKSRGEELNALAAAKKAIAENTKGAEKQAYGFSQTSFLQLTRSQAMSNSKYETVKFIRRLAQQQKSGALAQLAARIATAARGGDDPFAKVKGMIQDMLEKLEAEALADANHKAFCDKELAETNAKVDDKTSEIEKLTTKIEGMSSRSAELKQEVAALQKALAELTKAQAGMDKLRAQEKEDYAKAKADMEQGLEGVKMALKVLRDYYGSEKMHEAADGAGSGIIGLIEVAEADFSQGLIEMTSAEEAAQSTYDKETKDNEIEKVTKVGDVKYKTKEAGDLDKAVAEASNDKSSVEEELAAVNEYLKGIEGKCIAKAETFEERKARFQAELAGLKEALQILNGEAALLQTSARHAVRKGSARHDDLELA